ncbi:MAG TPA: hypothetical protein VD948_08700 [Rhodothermales bacterium]|nr:hypothetical protein [Rhodothermales bacterium]
MPPINHGAADEQSRWRGIRYRTLSASSVTSGCLWSTAQQGGFLEAYAHTMETAVYVYDHSRPTGDLGRLITVLVATPGAKSEPFPPAGSIPIERGVWVSFSTPTNGGVTLGVTR